MSRRHGPAGIAAAAIALVALVALAGCSSPPVKGGPPTGRSPTSPTAEGISGPLPPIPSESGAPGQAPVVWVGGTVVDLTDRQLLLKEALGSKVGLKRLGQDATAFFQVAGGKWERVDPASAVEKGARACVETLMDGQNLLALRVFLGTDCGPTA